MSRRLAAAAAAACLALVAGGCGSDRLPPRLTPGQRADLHTLVGQARTAAGAGNLAATNAALARLKARIRALRDGGALGKARAAELLKHAALAELKAAHTIQAPAATTATTPTPAPAPPAAVQPAPAVNPPPAPATAAGGAGGKAKKPKGGPRGKGPKPKGG